MYGIEKMNASRIGAGLVALSMLLLLTACGTRHVSRDISPEGQAGDVVFPSVDSIVLKDGTFPNRANLRQIGSGVSKDQLYDLVGRPHFREAFRAREWYYLFNFREADGSVTTCQYKVIFDREYRGQSFHWLPADCADQLLVKDGNSVAAAPATRFDVSADALFVFARWGREDILPGGHEQLITIAEQLEGSKASLVQVVGHTDRIGSEADNAALSQRRAETVRGLMVEHGVDAESVSAFGMGEAQPIKPCTGNLSRAELVDCLQPNRRVEIVVVGLE